MSTPSYPVRFYITSPYSTTPIPVTLTDDIYWAAQPLAVQPLRTASDPLPLAQQLAKSGYIIDVPIMVNGLDPTSCMCQRIVDGYTWVPSALQPNIPVGPGIAWPGQQYDPNNPPAGSIKCSVSAADYPPVNPVIVPPVADNVIGALQPNGMYLPGPGALSMGLPVHTLGDVFLDPATGKWYKAVMATSGFFNTLMFQPIAGPAPISGHANLGLIK